jgi:hypothetical protein
MILIRDFLADQKILIPPDANPSPTVSVVLPTYRRFKEGFLERSIKSVLAQKFEDFELLVIDDGSTDGSYDLVENFRARDPRVIHVRHEQNSGIHTVRLNEGIDLARGKYIAFQFDDDLCWVEPYSMASWGRASCRASRWTSFRSTRLTALPITVYCSPVRWSRHTVCTTHILACADCAIGISGCA